jgi:predicted DNA binding CopG/RHH family protein
LELWLLRRSTSLQVRLSEAAADAFKSKAELRGGASAVLRSLMADYAAGQSEPTEEAKGPALAKTTSKLTVRLTAQELAALRAEAAGQGLTPSRWGARALRARLTGQITFSRPEASALVEIAQQIARIGANLNQIARALNTDALRSERDCFTADEVRELAAQVMDFRADIRAAMRQKADYWRGDG